MPAKEGLITGVNVHEFFHESVTSAVNNQQVEATGEAVHYIVNLLTLFARSEALFEHTRDGLMLRPLAAFYCEAVEAPTREQRNAALRRLGDIALFISGVFTNSLNGKLVDVDYYIAMGGSAYGTLSDHVRGSARARAAADVFDELASKFVAFVDVLGEVSENTHVGSDADLLRVYDVWLKSGSNRAARKLRRHGIVPPVAPISQRRH